MMSLHAFITLSVLIEALTGVIKSVLKSFGLFLQDWMDQAISLGLSLIIAISGKVDFFAVLSQILPADFHLPSFLGFIISALVLSRGSNAVHDLLKQLNPPGPESKRIW